MEEEVVVDVTPAEAAEGKLGNEMCKAISYACSGLIIWSSIA